MSKIHQELVRIQNTLNAPKNQFNGHGKYKYRSCEDILAAFKQVQGECAILLTDTVEAVDGRVYIVAKATLLCEGETVSVEARAREAVSQKGMNDAQLTGSTSSYARKYALNGLFAIDDTQDADTNAYRQETQSRARAQQRQQTAPGTEKPLTETPLIEQAQAEIARCQAVLAGDERWKEWVDAAMNAGNYEDVIDKLQGMK